MRAGLTSESVSNNPVAVPYGSINHPLYNAGHIHEQSSLQVVPFSRGNVSLRTKWSTLVGDNWHELHFAMNRSSWDAREMTNPRFGAEYMIQVSHFAEERRRYL